MEKAKHKEEKEKLLEGLNEEYMSIEKSDAMKSLTQDFIVQDVKTMTTFFASVCVIRLSFSFV